MFVQHLLAHPECIENLCREFDEKRTDYAEKAGSNTLSGRLGEQVAVLEVAAKLAHDVLGFEWDYHPAIEKAWEQTVKRTSETMLVKLISRMNGGLHPRVAVFLSGAPYTEMVYASEEFTRERKCYAEAEPD